MLTALLNLSAVCTLNLLLFLCRFTHSFYRASAGYKIKDAKLGLFADFATGLNNEYIAAEKDADKNITGYETMEYKTEDGDDYVPLQVRGRVSFDATDTLSLNTFVKVNTLVGADASETVVYPYVNIKLPKFGTLNAGFRMKFNDNVGLAQFSIPLAWKYKLIDKK